MRRSYFIVLIIIFTLVIVLILQFVQYPIKTDKSSLELELQKFEEKEDIKIEKIKAIDNKIIALYIYDNGIGYGVFNKGCNGRCQLASSSRHIGGITFIEGDITTNKGAYHLFTGKNYDNMINSIEFTSEEGKKLIYGVSKEEYFILTINNPTGAFFFLKDGLLDEKGNSINEKITQKYWKKNVSGRSKTKAELELFNNWYMLVILISSSLIYLSYKVETKNSISNH